MNGQETIAYLTEIRGDLVSDLEKFTNGGWKMFEGATELRDITEDRIASLKRRISALDKRIAAYRER
jgi:hypothetical protein